MLDVYAWKLISLSEPVLSLGFLGVLVAGFVLGLLLLRKGITAMARLPYLFAYAANTLFVSLWPMTFAFTPDAAEAGVLWVLCALQVGALLIGGVVFAYVAKCRSQSAYGHTRAAWLALVPLANLMLFFAAPKDLGPITLQRRVFNVFATVIGLALFVSANASAQWAETFIESSIQEKVLEPKAAFAIITLRLGAGDLEGVLKEAASTVVETRLDEVTVLTDAFGEANTLTYNYRVDPASETLDADFVNALARDVCADQFAILVLRHGARFVFDYDYGDARSHSRFEVGLDDCPVS